MYAVIVYCFVLFSGDVIIFQILALMLVRDVHDR